LCKKAAPTGGVVSGEIIKVGGLVGICAYTAAEGDPVELHLIGAWRLPKPTTAITFSVGDIVYFDESASNVTSTSDTGTNKAIGTAIGAALEADTHVVVRLNGVHVA
jgi:predicted RecA/RadA family phage recombinase